MKPQRTKIVTVDFDGVIHQYVSPWVAADVIPDPPVPGAMAFLRDIAEEYRVRIFSTRNSQEGGIAAMKEYIFQHLAEEFGTEEAKRISARLKFPDSEKPKSHFFIDDRAFRFEGKWPTMDEIAAFRPWNKR